MGQGGQAVNTVPDKCPFCESQIMVHVGNLLVSEDGAFATYKCKTLQDIMWSDDQWKRTGQSDGCRKREVQLLTKQRDEARERIKRLESWIDSLETLEQHSGILPDREWFGSEIGYLRKGEAVYKGEAKP
jgi:hypothetical protein